MKPFADLDSQFVTIADSDIDTDQIIPARYLKTTNKLGLGDALFANWRFLDDGSPNPDFTINDPAMHGRNILLAGDNFGCGSSREHAPWALVAWGFRVIISTSFADIFRNNALKNGLLLITVSEAEHEALLGAAEATLQVTLAAQELRYGNVCVHFPIDAFSKRCLVKGLDQLAYIESFSEAITAYEDALGLETL